MATQELEYIHEDTDGVEHTYVVEYKPASTTDNWIEKGLAATGFEVVSIKEDGVAVGVDDKTMEKIFDKIFDEDTEEYSHEFHSDDE